MWMRGWCAVRGDASLRTHRKNRTKGEETCCCIALKSQWEGWSPLPPLPSSAASLPPLPATPKPSHVLVHNHPPFPSQPAPPCAASTPQRPQPPNLQPLNHPTLWENLNMLIPPLLLLLVLPCHAIVWWTRMVISCLVPKTLRYNELTSTMAIALLHSFRNYNDAHSILFLSILINICLVYLATSLKKRFLYLFIYMSIRMIIF